MDTFDALIAEAFTDAELDRLDDEVLVDLLVRLVEIQAMVDAAIARLVGA